MSASLLEIIYCSRESAPLGGPFDPKFAAILSVARRTNEQLGITGAMMFNSGYFLQLLEGPSEAVDRVFARIRNDPRHHDVVVVSRGPVTARRFPDWAMGFAATKDEPATAATLTLAMAAPDGEITDDLRTILQQSMATATVWGTDVPADEAAQG